MDTVKLTANLEARNERTAIVHRTPTFNHSLCGAPRMQETPPCFGAPIIRNTTAVRRPCA